MILESRGAPVRLDADAAVEGLYAAHWASLVRLGVLLLHDRGQAEDVVQDAFVATHRRWSRLTEPDRAVAYLRRAVVNGARSVQRHHAVERRAEPLLTQPLRATGAAYDDGASARAARDAVLDALRRLPRRQREVVVLRYYADLDEADIAATLGISRGAVKSHASRGLAALRADLGPRWEETP